MALAWILAVPLAGAAATFAGRRRAWIELIYCGGAGAVLVASVFLAAAVITGGPVSFLNGFLYADALSALVTLLTAVVWAVSAPYTVGYLRGPQPAASPAHLSLRDLRLYFTLSHLFAFTLLAVSLTGNLGIMWVALEGATLASVFLVAFGGKPTSLEAAWKYAILGGVGLSMALFGTVLTHYAAFEGTGMETWEALNWPFLFAAAPSFNPLVMRLAFILILLGYGTKAGLAPMHTWKPDAYSEAPEPAAALMATAMLNCALYGLGRLFLLSARATGPAMPSKLLVLFGLLSIAVATQFILVQKSYRRLLAYSSIDHCGIITLSLGFGGPLGSLGAVLHMAFHTLAKPLLFFSAGNAQQHTGGDSLRNTAGGLIHVLPVSGAALFAVVLAVTGTPPFPLFLSEFTVLRAGFAQGHSWASILAVILLVLIFSGMFAHAARLLLGPAPDLPPGDRNRWTVYPLGVLAVLLLALAFWMPSALSSLLTQAAQPAGGEIMSRPGSAAFDGLMAEVRALAAAPCEKTPAEVRVFLEKPPAGRNLPGRCWRGAAVSLPSLPKTAAQPKAPAISTTWSNTRTTSDISSSATGWRRISRSSPPSPCRLRPPTGWSARSRTGLASRPKATPTRAAWRFTTTGPMYTRCARTSPSTRCCLRSKATRTSSARRSAKESFTSR